jgi:hypothetical protein
MKLVKLMGALAICASAAMQPATAAWNLTGSQGVRHFVTVPAGEASEAVYRQAASSVCRPGPCIVMFWTDVSQAASRMPLTRAQSDALTAQYARNPATGQDSLLLRCAPGASAKGRCLK